MAQKKHVRIVEGRKALYAVIVTEVTASVLPATELVNKDISDDNFNKA